MKEISLYNTWKNILFENKTCKLKMYVVISRGVIKMILKNKEKGIAKKPKEQVKFSNKNIWIMPKKVRKEQQKEKNRWDKWKTNSKMEDLNMNMSIITLNVNVINTPT